MASAIVKKIRRWPTWLRRVVGIILIITGIIGLAVPIMPTWILVIPGLLMFLGEESRFAKWMVAKRHELRDWWRTRRGKPPLYRKSSETD